MDPALEAAICAYEARLKSRHPGVSACWMSVEDRLPRPYERRRFNARVFLVFNGREIVVNREHDTDPALALRQAFEASSRQLEALEAAAERA